MVTNYGIISDGILCEEIEAKELRKRCCRYVKIVCADANRALTILRANFANMRAEFGQGGIYVSSHLDKAAEINACLVREEISVSELSHFESSFEDYFIERLGK